MLVSLLLSSEQSTSDVDVDWPLDMAHAYHIIIGQFIISCGHTCMNTRQSSIPLHLFHDSSMTVSARSQMISVR